MRLGAIAQNQLEIGATRQHLPIHAGACHRATRDGNHAAQTCGRAADFDRGCNGDGQVTQMHQRGGRQGFIHR